nr:NADH-quinone oxidoreductase subunit NuoE [Amycolatopsis rubida]
MPDLAEVLADDAEEILARYPVRRSALLPLLHLVQSERGCVDVDGISFCASTLGLAEAEVLAVATFHSMFHREPVGDHLVAVCTSTLCAVLGGDAIRDSLRTHLGLSGDGTTEDGAVTLATVACVAACDYAPVVMANWEYFDEMTPARARELVDDLRAGRAVWPTRGVGPLCTFRQNTRLLAGFPDERSYVDSAVTTPGPRTTEGVRLAEAQGWHAPEEKP